jgi:hypothetical protein
MSAIKQWTTHPDIILSILCQDVIRRRLLKVRYLSNEPREKEIEQKKMIVMNYLKISEEEAGYFVFTGQTENNTYNTEDEHIQILFKNGNVLDISEVDNALINQTLFGTVKKFYICYPNIDIDLV